ncbi:MAG TPA: phosphodiesterase [Stellaceae bacterium]|jgi:3',5'-cyclic AMP phosphodiesterase CpdA|nr:phosphodiesterase [Stellaceae bacterium]
MIVAQLSDLHIVPPGQLLYDRVDTAAFLSRAVTEINALDPLPDIVVITGDLVERGAPAEYAHLRQLIAPLLMPVFVITGNHDNRAALRDAFGGDGYLPAEGFLHYTVEGYPVRLIALDTLVPDHHRGRLCAARLEWLDRTLAEMPDTPTLVLMHHPPFVTGIDFMDRFGMEGTAGLAAVIGRHGHVERILCGHLHRAIDRRFAGTIAGTAPSTAHQIRLNLNADAPLRFMFEPPGYQLHIWNDTGLVTHTAVIGDWAGPYPFRAAS